MKKNFELLISWIIVLSMFIVPVLLFKLAYGKIVYGDWKCGIAECRIQK